MENSNLPNSNFGIELQRAMKAKGYTYTTLGKASGVNKSVIFGWANGSQPRTIENLMAIAKVLDVTLDELFGGSKENQKVYKVIVTEL